MRTIDDPHYRKIIERRDPRYDGRFYWGVKTTRIYCRPICPARPKAENIRIFKSATEAEKAGFRPCLRCRPDLAPGSQRWEGTAVSVARALRLMEEGAEAAASVETLAATLGMSDRHLRRLFAEHLGASPVEIMVNQRLHLARQLIVETNQPLTDIAFAAGFQSIRRFNEAFKGLYQKPPSAFRRQSQQNDRADFQLSLAVRLPYDWSTILAFLKRHAIFGVERVDASGYTRYIPRPAREPGQVHVSLNGNALVLSLRGISLQELRPLMARLRQLFDVDHNPIDLPQNSAFQPDGIRIPGCFDAYEVAVSIIMGQLVSVTHARDKMQKLVMSYGHRLAEEEIFSFPSPALLKNAELETLGLTRQKAEAIRELSRLISVGTLQLSRTADIPETRARLQEIPGIGPWTIELIAMRCLGDADAFPRKDLIIGRALAGGLQEEELWLSLRSYLTQILWRDYAHAASIKKGVRP